MLFRKENNLKNEEIKKFISVSLGLSFDKLQSFLLSAEYTYIVRILGDKLYKQLTDYYYSLPNNYNVTSTDFPKYNQSDFSNHDYTTDKILVGEDPDKKNVLPLYDLLQFCQAALIKLAIYEGYPELKANLSDTGFEAPDPNKRLFKYEDDELRRSYIDSGLRWIDRTIGFLIKNIKDESLKSFSESPCYAEFNDSIVQTTEQFDRVYNIRGNRLVFLNMRPFMNDIVDLEISKIFSYEILEDLKANRSASESDPDKIKLLAYISNAVIHLAVSRAVIEYGLQFGDPGAFFVSTEPSGTNNERRTAGEITRIAEIQKNHAMIGAGWLSNAISLATANNILCSPETGQNIHRSTNFKKRTFWT